ncbi:prepilin-type N-terminal cleavage/methylation domain-containing protein [Lysinibacillus sp. 54212]|uniref:prepilin-type N-terminal cleavage/methylation domain-containing protein n=1 Tax=Lysinibacillus sp. 54212 TaxID=3119829 RepID=UPI002FC75790
MQLTSVQKQNTIQNNKGGFYMFELMKKRIKNEKGLSLVELLAVIVILAIVAAIAIPAIGNIIENSRLNGVKSDAINVINSANLYYTDNPEATTVDVKKLKEDKYLDSEGTIPADATISVDVPRKLTAAAIKFSGEKTVTFKGATVKGINDEKTKGSAVPDTGLSIEK